MNLFQNHSGKPLPGTFASITGAPLLVPPSPSRPHREHPSQPVRRAAGDGGNGGGGEPGRCGEALARSSRGGAPAREGGREAGLCTSQQESGSRRYMYVGRLRSHRR